MSMRDAEEGGPEKKKHDMIASWEREGPVWSKKRELE